MGIEPGKKTSWTIRRIVFLMGCVVYGFSLSMGTIYYLLINNITMPRPVGMFVFLLVFLGPWVPPLMYINAKKKKVAKESQKLQSAEMTRRDKTQ